MTLRLFVIHEDEGCVADEEKLSSVLICIDAAFATGSLISVTTNKVVKI